MMTIKRILWCLRKATQTGSIIVQILPDFFEFIQGLPMNGIAIGSVVDYLENQFTECYFDSVHELRRCVTVDRVILSPEWINIRTKMVIEFSENRKWMKT
jgi:hypothetical protein